MPARAEYRDADIYEDTPIAVTLADTFGSGLTHLLPIAEARELWRELGRAITDADSAEARRAVGSNPEEG